MEFSELEAEWHPTLNLPLVFNDTLPLTTKYWWFGECGHEWDARLRDRIKGNRCPFCSGYLVLLGFNDLTTTHPTVSAQWHPTKNGEQQPQQVKGRSSHKAWWLGSCGHEWEAQIASRAMKNNGCPICANKYVLEGFNDLNTKNPHLAAEWHPTKNGELTPQQVTVSSGKLAWWLGACGHEWDSIIHNRNKGRGCPYCAGQKIRIGFNDLASTSPSLPAEWHPTKNGNLTAQKVTISSDKKVWWLAACGHEWDAALSSRKAGNGCPVCSGYRVLEGFNDLASTNPSLATEWHPTKNGQLTPKQMMGRTVKKAWWLCNEEHEWEAPVERRSRGIGCPYCSSQKILAGYNDLASKCPDIALEWHPTKNGKLAPNQVAMRSNLKVWWLGQCGHEWDAVVDNRTTKKTGCPVCSGKSIRARTNDLATTNPLLANEWHPAKNGISTANEVSSGSHNKVWWLGKCGHEWKTSVQNRHIRGDGCPVCSGAKILIGFNDFGTLYPQLAEEWHPTNNGKLTPTAITAGLSKKVWWLGKCGHEWESSPYYRVKYPKCHVCSHKILLVGFNDLETTHPDLSSEYHPTRNKQLTVQQLTSRADKKVWWLGKCGHEWKALVRSRTRTGSGCAKCAVTVSKAEEHIKEFLIELGLTIESSNRSLLGGKEIDLWIPEKQVGIEFNGIYWHTESWGKGISYHHDKWKACESLGIQLIQIWEDDWNQKQDVVKNVLKQKLGVAGKLLSEKTDVVTVTKQQAEEFLTKNHIEGYEEGSHYLGLVSKGDIETLRAVMVLGEEPETDGKVLNIFRYATNANVVDGFTKLLAYATKNYQPESFIVTADHCVPAVQLYEDNGFIVEKVLPPDYMYVVRNERKPRSEYPLERFRDDPKLLWEEGLTEMEVADLNGLDRIWDAGKTFYKLSL